MTISEIEIFLAEHRNIALAFFSCSGFLWGLVATINRTKQMLREKTQEAVEDALIDQRQRFQSGYVDQWEKRYDRLLDKYADLAIKVERISKDSSSEPQ